METRDADKALANADHLGQRMREFASRVVNRASELNQFWKSIGMEREESGEFAEVGFLPRKIEQDLRGRGKWMRRRIADHAQR